MAKPATREMGVSDARANMTEVIAEVRLLGTPVVLTRRDKPQAVLVSVDWYDQALKYKSVAEAALRFIAEAPDPDTAAQRLEALVGEVEPDGRPDIEIRHRDGSYTAFEVKSTSTQRRRR